MLSVELKLNHFAIGSILIHNDGTGTDALGNYDFWISIPEQEIEHRGRVLQFPRDEGAFILLLKVLECIQKELGKELRYPPQGRSS